MSRKKRETPRPVLVQPLLLRTGEAAIVLSISESEVLKRARAGELRTIRIPAELGKGELRAVRFSTAEVQALAQRWIDAGTKPAGEGESLSEP